MPAASAAPMTSRLFPPPGMPNRTLDPAADNDLAITAASSEAFNTSPDGLFRSSRQCRRSGLGVLLCSGETLEPAKPSAAVSGEGQFDAASGAIVVDEDLAYAQPCFASPSPVRHAPHFARTLGESRRQMA